MAKRQIKNNKAIPLNSVAGESRKLFESGGR